jgi:hypothetical protein
MIEHAKKTTALPILRVLALRYTAIAIPSEEISGRPIARMVANGPGIIPMPNRGGSLGMNANPHTVMTR